MLIQFHATLASSCNLRDIKDINGIAFFAYFDGTFSQRGIQFLFSTFVYNLCFECPNLQQSFSSDLESSCEKDKSVTLKSVKLWNVSEKKNITIYNQNICRLKILIIGFMPVETGSRASHSQVSPIEGCPETETYYPGRDYAPRASQLNIIHLKASAFAVSLRCHP